MENRKIDKESFEWIVNQVADLEPNDKVIRLDDRITLIFRYAYVHDAIIPKESIKDDLLLRLSPEDSITLEFFVEGLVPNYEIYLTVSRRREDDFELWFIQNIPGEVVNSIVSLIKKKVTNKKIEMDRKKFEEKWQKQK